MLVPCTMSPGVLPTPRAPSRTRTCAATFGGWRLIRSTMGAASVREESNLHAEATGLRPAGLTTCPTHGWGGQRVLPPLRRGSQPRSSLVGLAATVPSGGAAPPASPMWMERSAVELTGLAYSQEDSNLQRQIRGLL
jgi:hypothetical protein